MIESDAGSKQKCLFRLVILLCIICLNLSCSTIYPPKEKNPITADEPKDVMEAEQHARDVALRSATKTVTSGSKPSLEMKENVDFLLTPALLMQEALSDKVITTYPSE
jgi:hypothetical protein